MDLRELEVKKGDPVLPAWERLKAWARRFELRAGSGVRFNQMPEGTWVIAEPAVQSWNHPFRVSVSDKIARIGNGSVNNLIPQIDGIGLDGMNQDGKEVTAPELKITSGPDADLRSWICVQAKVDLKTGKIDPKDETALTVVHVNSLAPQSADTGLQPLAMLSWSDTTTISRVFQITHHNLSHSFVAANAAKGQTTRHFFWAV